MVVRAKADAIRAAAALARLQAKAILAAAAVAPDSEGHDPAAPPRAPRPGVDAVARHAASAHNAHYAL